MRQRPRRRVARKRTCRSTDADYKIQKVDICHDGNCWSGGSYLFGCDPPLLRWVDAIIRRQTRFVPALVERLTLIAVEQSANKAVDTCSTTMPRSNNPPRRSRTTEASFVRTAPPHADLQSHTNQTHRQRKDAPKTFVCNKSARPVDAVLDNDAALEQSTSEVSNDGSAVRADCSAARRPAKPHQPNASSTQRCSQIFRLQQVRKTGRCRARQRRCAQATHLGGLERRKCRSCGLLRRTPTCKATPTKRIVERNDAPRPFVCNKSAKTIIEKPNQCLRLLLESVP